MTEIMVGIVFIVGIAGLVVIAALGGASAADTEDEWERQRRYYEDEDNNKHPSWYQACDIYCPYCGAGFSEQDGLRCHLLNDHKNQ